jgi:hypothetical protein
MMKRFALLAVVVAPLFAAACGGGQPAPAGPANPAGSAASSAAPSAAPAGSGANEAPSASAAAAAPSASASASAAAGAPGPGQWDTWSRDQKMAYMKSAVMPKMGGMFHDFDAKKYGEPRCTLCHGSGAKAGNFKMPNAELPKLDITPEGFKALKEKKPQVVEFMVKVEHEAAHLIGEEPFDPKTMKGFGCLNCHTKK